MYLFSEVFDLKPTRTDRIWRVSAGNDSNCPGGTLEISRWRKPPVGVMNIGPSPGQGLGKSRGEHSVARPGLAAYCVRDRWFTPPANVHDASGVRYATQP